MTLLLGILSLLALACLVSPILLVWAALWNQEAILHADDWAGEQTTKRW